VINPDATLEDLFTHLYVLIPVLDADKRHWVGKDKDKDEVETPLRHGEGWLHAISEAQLSAKTPHQHQIRFSELVLNKNERFGVPGQAEAPTGLLF
jgi:hypothetical protein